MSGPMRCRTKFSSVLASPVTASYWNDAEVIEDIYLPIGQCDGQTYGEVGFG